MLKSAEIKQEIENLAKKGEELISVKNMTDSQREELQSITDKINSLNDELQRTETVENALKNSTGGTKTVTNTKKKARTLGEHFVMHAGETIRRTNGKENISVPEFRNADIEPQLTTDNEGYAQFATELDTAQITERKQAGILDLFPVGSTTKPAVTYFVKTFADISTGRKGATAEGTTKNKRRYERTVITDNAGKFTGLLDMSKEMVTDLDFVATEINNDLKKDVELDAEYQLLNGDGTNPNIKGILHRSGILSVTSTAVEDNDKAIYSAINKIETITPFKVDGVVMHPEDYETLRLKKDENGQFVGGGMFQNQYGNGNLVFKPAVWTIERTVSSPFCPKGKVIVGAFDSGAKVLKLGGTTIDMTNSNNDNFEKNLLTFLAEQRVILQVKVPQCFCVVNLATGE